MGSDKILLRNVHHKPFTIKFPDKCELEDGLNPDNKQSLVWYTGSRPIMALVLGCKDGAQEGGTASVLGSTPWHSRLKCH